MTGHGVAGVTWFGGDWIGLAGPARLGEAWSGRSWSGSAWPAGHGLGRLVKGNAGAVRLGRDRQGKAWQAGHGWAWLGTGWRGRQAFNREEGEMSIEQEIVDLTDADGFIKPHRVVAWAKDNPTSELHGKFEWDDARAAESYRLDQARRLIAIHVLSDDGTRATISLVQDRSPDGGYRHLGAVISNSDLRMMALRQAMREFRRWEARYKHLIELARVFDAAKEVEGDGTGERAA